MWKIQDSFALKSELGTLLEHETVCFWHLRSLSSERAVSTDFVRNFWLQVLYAPASIYARNLSSGKNKVNSQGSKDRFISHSLFVKYHNQDPLHQRKMDRASVPVPTTSPFMAVLRKRALISNILPRDVRTLGGGGGKNLFFLRN